jgi:AraC family transcriptional regulator
MKESSCPYCNSAQSLLMGNVYCSHQPGKMEQLNTGTLFIKSKKLEETTSHISRLSIRCMLNGNQYYKVGNHEHLVTPENFLVINQGQNYKTSFESTEEQEMILVGFKPGFAEELLYSLRTSSDKLLDEPFNNHNQSVYFFENTYHADPVISKSFRQLRNFLKETIEWRKTIDLDSIYTTMLSRLLVIHRNLSLQINKLDSIKYSTRVELYRRLMIAKDYLDSNLNRKVNIDEVARIAYLSPFHLKRSFKKLFKITPHNYHVHKRLEFSCKLISQNKLTVNEICHRVGFDSPTSFIRLFQSQYGCTPGRLARQLLNNDDIK